LVQVTVRSYVNTIYVRSSVEKKGGGEHGGGRCTVRGARKCVEIPFTIAAKDHAMSLQVLHRKTKSVKLDRTKVITSKFVDEE
jgi:hypothetical protein